MQRSLTSGNSVTVTETDPGDDRWTLSALVCQQYNAAGQLVTIAGATNVAARKVTLTNVPPPEYLADPSHHLHLHQHVHATDHAHPGQAGAGGRRQSHAVDPDRNRNGAPPAAGTVDLGTVRVGCRHEPSGSSPAPISSPSRARARRRPGTCRSGTGPARPPDVLPGDRDGIVTLPDLPAGHRPSPARSSTGRPPARCRSARSSTTRPGATRAAPRRRSPARTTAGQVSPGPSRP